MKTATVTFSSQIHAAVAMNELRWKPMFGPGLKIDFAPPEGPRCISIDGIAHRTPDALQLELSVRATRLQQHACPLCDASVHVRSLSAR